MNKLLFVFALNIVFISNLFGQTERGIWGTHHMGYIDTGIYFNPGDTEATVEIDLNTTLGVGQYVTQASSIIGRATIEGNKVFFTFQKSRLQRELEGLSPNSIQIPGTIIVEPANEIMYDRESYEVRIMWEYDNLFN